MLNDVTSFSKVMIVTGRTDLRRGIDGLSSIIHNHYGISPFEAHVLFLFCGNRNDRIKGLVWQGDGFLLLYKRLEQGAFQWPRNEKEVKSLTSQQYRWLMEGLSIYQNKAIPQTNPQRSA
jgi:transposase